MYKNKEQITAWLDKMEITGYVINKNLTVDVVVDVELSGKNLNFFPVQFREVSGDFNCSHNYLTSLKGAPRSVIGDFNCNGNELSSLKCVPQKIYGSFNASQNKLVSLLSGPKEVGDNYIVFSNALKSFKGIPKVIGGNLNCNDNNLTSFEFAPNKIEKNFICQDNDFMSLEHLPLNIGGKIYFRQERAIDLLEPLKDCAENHDEQGLAMNFDIFKKHLNALELSKSLQAKLTNKPVQAKVKI